MAAAVSKPQGDTQTADEDGDVEERLNYIFEAFLRSPLDKGWQKAITGKVGAFDFPTTKSKKEEDKKATLKKRGPRKRSYSSHERSAGKRAVPSAGGGMAGARRNMGPSVIANARKPIDSRKRPRDVRDVRILDARDVRSRPSHSRGGPMPRQPQPRPAALHEVHVAKHQSQRGLRGNGGVRNDQLRGNVSGGGSRGMATSRYPFRNNADLARAERKKIQEQEILERRERDRQDQINKRGSSYTGNQSSTTPAALNYTSIGQDAYVAGYQSRPSMHPNISMKMLPQIRTSAESQAFAVNTPVSPSGVAAVYPQDRVPRPAGGYTTTTFVQAAPTGTAFYAAYPSQPQFQAGSRQVVVNPRQFQDVRQVQSMQQSQGTRQQQGSSRGGYGNSNGGNQYSYRR